MDNLSVHKSKVIRERMDELGFAYIFAPAYSPQYNPIEGVFSVAKGYIKKRRLEAIVNEYEIDMYELIH